MKNYIIKLFMLFTGLLIVQSHANAQDNSVALVNVIPPSPNAAALGKFGNTPVGYFTGVPSISVPIYEIKSGKLKVPITVSYHASGIKVEEVASWVGLGWGLSFGGSISRGVRGIGDEELNGFLNLNGNLTADQLYANQTTVTGTQQLIAAGKGQVDSEADMFNFSMGNVSGKFVYNQNDGQFHAIPQQDVKIQYSFADGFVLTTSDGNTYYFNTRETTTTQPICSPATANSSTHTTSWNLSKIVSADKKDTVTFTYDNSSNFYYYTRGTETKYILESWSGAAYGMIPDYNTSVCTTNINITPQRLQQIKFKNGKLTFNISSASRCDIDDKILDNIVLTDLQNNVIDKWQFNYGYFGSTNGTPTPCGNNDALRLKLKSIQQTATVGGVQQLLNPYIFEYNETYQLPSRMSFAQDYWGGFNGKTSNTTLIPPYVFMGSTGPTYWAGADRLVDTVFCKTGVLQKVTYPTMGSTTYEYESNKVNDTALIVLPKHNQVALYGDNIGVKTSYDTTFTLNYGPNAYNANNANGGAFLSFSFGDIGCDLSGGASTCAILSLDGLSPGATGFTVSQQLDHIYIPNGTYRLKATFNQNPPQFQDFYFIAKWDSPDSTLQTYRFTGGLRVKRITDYDGIDHTKDIIRSFTYTRENDSNTSSGLINGTPNAYNYAAPHFQTVHFSRNEYGDAFFLYRNYTKLLSYSNQPFIQTQGNYTSYDFVTVTFGPNGENGKTTYKYMQVPDQINPLPAFEATSNEYRRGLLLEQKDYRKDGNSYALVNKVRNTYAKKSLPAGTLATSLKLFINSASTGFDNNDQIPYVGKYVDTCTWIGLVKTVQTTYGNAVADSSFTTKEMGYSNYHFMPIKEKITSSLGDSVVTTYMYPPDYVGLIANDHVTAGIKNLQNNFVIASPVETVTRRKDASNTKNNFALFHTYQSNNPVVDTIWRTELSSPAASFTPSAVSGGAISKSAAYIPRIGFQYESAGNNLAEQYKVQGPHDAYLWDYNHDFVIASVTNATVNDIAYTSFEADGSGNWVIPAAARDNTSFITGKKSYNLSNGSVTLSGLNSNKTYIVSYWSYSSTGSASFNVNGTAAHQGNTIGQWTYYEHTITGTSSVSVSGASDIDELRLYPVDAQMTTYTYDPLVGLTTSTDAKGQPTYYEYDAFQRLMNVRDQDGKVLKHIDYHFQNQ